jgi:hypothetical protein
MQGLLLLSLLLLSLLLLLLPVFSPLRSFCQSSCCNPHM